MTRYLVHLVLAGGLLSAGTAQAYGNPDDVTAPYASERGAGVLSGPDRTAQPYGICETPPVPWKVPGNRDWFPSGAPAEPPRPAVIPGTDNPRN